VARTDAIVLGGGIVGTSTALQLAKRGLSVALVERAGLGEETSFGNAGTITKTDAANREAVVAALLDALPEAVAAQVHRRLLDGDHSAWGMGSQCQEARS